MSCGFAYEFEIRVCEDGKVIFAYEFGSRVYADEVIIFKS